MIRAAWAMFNFFAERQARHQTHRADTLHPCAIPSTAWTDHLRRGAVFLLEKFKHLKKRPERSHARI
jgi:hypothetical protein